MPDIQGLLTIDATLYDLALTLIRSYVEWVTQPAPTAKGSTMHPDTLVTLAKIAEVTSYTTDALKKNHQNAEVLFEGYRGGEWQVFLWVAPKPSDVAHTGRIVFAGDRW